MVYPAPKAVPKPVVSLLVLAKKVLFVGFAYILAISKAGLKEIELANDEAAMSRVGVVVFLTRPLMFGMAPRTEPVTVVPNNLYTAFILSNPVTSAIA